MFLAKKRHRACVLWDWPVIRLIHDVAGNSVSVVVSRPEAGWSVTTSADQVTNQVTDQVTSEVLRLLSVMQGDMSRAEIQEKLGLKHLPHLRDAYLNPALDQGLIEMTLPDKPRSRLQKYRLTAAGQTRLQQIIQ